MNLAFLALLPAALLIDRLFGYILMEITLFPDHLSTRLVLW